MPTGAFKVRGGIYLHRLAEAHPSRGPRHRHRHPATTASPRPAPPPPRRGSKRRSTSPGPATWSKKNAAGRAPTAPVLITHGTDFDTAREEAMRVAALGDYYPVPPFHPELVRGVATYGWELLTAHPDLDTHQPCRSARAPASSAPSPPATRSGSTPRWSASSRPKPPGQSSVEAGHLVELNSARTFADGMAVRVPVQARRSTSTAPAPTASSR
ncbi:MAG: hypothetical protein R3D59_18040 [Paracoccaceae bacterium]